MSDAPLHTVIRRLHRLARPEGVAGLNDDALLRRFVSDRDEAAFEVLVWRHGGAVLALCRRLLGDAHDAEDAFQAAFLTLARRAGSIARRQAVAAWLCRVAFRIALKLRARRRRQAGPCPPPDELPAREGTPDLIWRDLRPVLDEEINGLPEKYRVPFLLCYLHGKTHVEAAEELGWPQGTVATRLAGARERLRDRLTRRGVTLSCAALTTLLADHAAAAATPARLVVATVRAAVRFGAGAPAAGLVSAQAAELTRQALTRLALARWRFAAALLLALGLLAGGAGLAFRQPGAAHASAPQSGRAEAKEGGEERAAPRRLSGKVVDGAGRPVAAATVWLTGGSYEHAPRVLARGTTDADGRFSLSLPAEKPAAQDRRPTLVARDPRGRLGWTQPVQWDKPGEPTIPLNEVGEVRGRVVDGAGAPIAGARLATEFAYASSPRQGRSPSLEFPAEWDKEYAARTAADGSFVLRGLPSAGALIAIVSAPGFGGPRVTWECAKPVTIRLSRAATVRGSVRCAADPKRAAGVPLRLFREADPDTGADSRLAYLRIKAVTGPDGAFRVADVPPGKYTVTPDLAPGMPFRAAPVAPLEIKPGATVTVPAIALEPALVVRGRVVDRASGAGIAGVEVWVGHLSPQNVFTDLMPVTTDAQGRYTGYTKPGRVRVEVRRTPGDYVMPGNELLDPCPEGVKELDYPIITLARTVPVRGVVVDEAGRPVAGASVQALIPYGGWDSGPTAFTDAAGKFTLKGLDPTDTAPLRVRTERAVTDGAVVIVPAERKEPVRLVVSPKYAFRLKGTVVGPDGRPVAKARVMLFWQRNYVSKRTRLAGIGGNFEEYATDADGGFVTGPLWPGDTYRVEVTAPGYGKGGSAQIRGRTGETRELPRLVLARSGGVVRGRVMDSAGRPVAGARVFNVGDAPRQVGTQTDAEGRFRLEGLYDGSVYVFAQKAGFRFTAWKLAADGKETALTLPRTSETPRQPAPATSGASTPARHRKLARELLDRLGATVRPDQPDGRRVLEGLARLEPAEALRRAARAGDRELRAVHVQLAEQVAATDADEALALLAAVDAGSAVHSLRELAERFLPTDPARALRFAEELAVRARTVDPPQRGWALAQAGGLVMRLGKTEAGRKLLAEAEELVGRLGAGPMQAYARGLVAEQLAPYDLPRALKLLEPITERRDRERYRGNVAVALAASDLARALELAKGLGHESQIKLRIAHALAARDPSAAVRVAEGITEAKERAEALGWVAVGIAARDRKRAHALIDRALDICLTEKDAFRSWSNFGGRSVFAARLACQAREVGYPDMASVVARVLATRLTDAESDPAHVAESHTMTALLLSAVDRGAARELLRAAESRGPVVGAGNGYVRRRERVRAWALVDPVPFTRRLEKELSAGKGGRPAQAVYEDLLEVAEVLSVPPEQRLRFILRRGSAFWFPGEE